MRGFGAVVLAGGAARRMGGADKPGLPIAGRTMLVRVLDAVNFASPRVVVGPVAAVPPDVRTTIEHPPGSGPVAATAAGLALLDESTETVALLAADLPLLTAEAVAHLHIAVEFSTVDGAVYVDGDGRRQLLCGVWRVAALRGALDRLAAGRGLADAPIRTLFDGLEVGGVSWTEPGPPPWFDCDTDDDLRRAEKWAR